jgi:hypothetical protein
MNKPLKIFMSLYRIIPVIVTGLLLFISCSTTKEAACPEFPDKRNYSIKYRADHKTNRKYERNQSTKRTVKAETHIFIITRSTNKFSVDFTINQNELPEYESYRLIPFPNIAPEQTPFKR